MSTSRNCYSELALKNPTQHVGLVQSRPHHHVIEIQHVKSRHDIALKIAPLSLLLVC